MDNKLQLLRKELADLGDEFGQKVASLERRIDALESYDVLLEPNEDAAFINPVPKFAAESINSTENEPIQPTPTPATDDTNAFVKEAGKQSLFAALAPFSGPFSGLIEQFSNLYQHYHKQGKAPVFFMTLTGIIALVFGFGYLFQYSFNEYLGPVGKVFLGFSIAIATTVSGVLFTKNRNSMAEYGSSIIALGVVLNYICAYFAGPYYGVLPGFLGFLLLVTVTAVAYLLALLFETRIVAIVTLVGGASMPLVMGHVDHTPLLYLAYLLVLSSCMLNLSQRIRWPQLAWVSMALSAGMVGYSIGNRESVQSVLGFAEPYGLIAVIHGFFYVFAHYAMRGLSRIAPMNEIRLLILSANIAFYLVASQQLVTSSVLLGTLYLLNILPWVALFFLPRKVFGYLAGSDEFRTVQVLSLLYAGLMAGVGILVLSSPEWLGIIWCVEALILVYLGGKFNFTSVRIEGYIAFLVSFVGMGEQVMLWVQDAIVSVPVILDLNFGFGWINLIAITLLVFGMVTLIRQQQSYLTDREHYLLLILDNLFSVCLSLSFLLTVGIFLPEGMWLSAIAPMFYLIIRAQKKELFVTELIGLGHFLLLVVPVLISASVAGNFHFSEQSIYGQIARVEAFVSLWLLAEFYKRFYSQSAYFEFTEHLRKLFYCIIPVFFLPSIFRQHSDYFPLVLWGGCVIALFLYDRLQFTVLKLELRLLVFVASIAAIASCWLAKFENWQGNATAALVAGLAFYLFIGWLGQGLRRKPVGSASNKHRHWALKPLFTTAVYYFALAVFIILYGVTANVELAIVAVLLYFTGLFFKRPVLAPVRLNLRVVYGLTFILFGVLTLLHAFSVLSQSAGGMKALMLGLFNGMAVSCVAFIVYSACAQSRAVLRVTGGQILNICLFNLITIAAYISLLTQLFSTMLGPVISFSLVVHATVILFQSVKPEMKKLIWLSVMLYGVAALKVLLWDMADFSIVQKIVVLMLIGLCMLGAAFKFQKVVVRVPGSRD